MPEQGSVLRSLSGSFVGFLIQVDVCFQATGIIPLLSNNGTCYGFCLTPYTKPDRYVHSLFAHDECGRSEN